MARTGRKTKKSPVSLSIEIARLFDARMRTEMHKNGIRASYIQLLYSLSQEDGVTQLELVKISKLKAPTISATLRNMEADGFVSRQTDKDDGRATRVFITEKGKEAEKKMRAVSARLERAFLSVTSAAEKEQLTELLGKIKENMGKKCGMTFEDIDLGEEE